MNRTIYLDNAATTPMLPPVLDAMLPYFCDIYGNPSSGGIYEMGAAAKRAVDDARTKVAAALHCTPQEIYFTSCGTEADNWAIKGTAHRLAEKGKKHLITSTIEHHAVLHSMQTLESEGFSVTYLPVDQDGFVTPADVAAAIRPDTALVSIMYANNEIGTIEPIAEIGAICREKGVWFHTDAVQAAGAIPIDVQAENIDMLSLSGHKFNGPKGVGVLYIRKGIHPLNYMDGGAQENRRRAGTENVAGIVGLATALDLAVKSLSQKAQKLSSLRDFVIAHTMQIERAELNGPADGHNRLPNNVNVSFPAAESESILLFLNTRGICASSGSACASGDLEPSHVLLAIGVPHAVANCSVRISFGVQNTMEDAEVVCAALDETVAEVRRRSAIWKIRR